MTFYFLKHYNKCFKKKKKTSPDTLWPLTFDFIGPFWQINKLINNFFLQLKMLKITWISGLRKKIIEKSIESQELTCFCLTLKCCFQYMLFYGWNSKEIICQKNNALPMANGFMLFELIFYLRLFFALRSQSYKRNWAWKSLN